METSPSIHGTHVPSTRADEGREPIKIINGVNGISSYANPAEPIAICGIGLRLPGGIRDGKSFWKALYNGVDLRTPIPKSRFNAEGFGLALGSKGGFDVSHGYFLEEDLGAFDASFFTGTRNEYEKIDPQVRKLLEVTRECLENAGEIGYRGKSVGVYVGTFGDDWMVQQLKEGGQYTGGYNFSADILLANRVSYEFDFRGPSMVLKTGCSASLVALHNACRALQDRDCEAAVVGGTSLIMGTHTYAAMAAEGILSPDGSCKSFDAAANGFGRAEAINAIYIKRLDDAVRDGNPIRAVIRNVGSNSNGRSKSLMSPDAVAQEQLIRSVYAGANIDPRDTGFLECHGTGTPTGDPIETTAVANVFGNLGITIGSVKPNVGHSEGASGITGIIKAIFALEYNIIPPNIKFNNPNPNIPFEKGRLTVPTEVMSWPSDRAERVSINSFGIGGSNAHVIVESPSAFLLQYSTPTNGITQRHCDSSLILVSANSQTSLDQMISLYRQYYKDKPQNMRDLAYTLAHRREHLRYRSFFVISSFSLGETSPLTEKSKVPNIVLVFSGQGAQWLGMAASLMKNDPSFREDIAAMDKMLQNLKYKPEWHIEDELLREPDETGIYTAELSQPICTAMQIALVNACQRAGVKPAAVIGHSSGEIAAAYAAGVLSMREAMVLAFYRGFVMNYKQPEGAMAAVGLGSQRVSQLLVHGVVVAAENSPESTTISGDIKAVESVMAMVKMRYPEVLVRRIHVDKAYHSHHMMPLAERYLGLVLDEGDIPTRAPEVNMFSTVTGQLHESPIPISYWAENLTSPVKFAAAASVLINAVPRTVLLEVGPHSQLAGPLRQITGPRFDYIPTLVRGKNCYQSLLTTFGKLFLRGVPLNFANIVPKGEVLTDLPPYPWDHGTSYWHESRPSQAWKNRKYGHHALLGQRIPESLDAEPSWRCILDLEDEPWLSDHIVKGTIIFPLAGYVAMAGEAVRQATGNNSGYLIKNIIAHSALILRPSQPVEVVTTFRRRKLNDTNGSDYFDFTISSCAGGHDVKHCDGQVKSLQFDGSAGPTPSPLSRKVSSKRWYEAMSQCGYNFGPAFCTLQNIEASPTDKCAVASVAAHDSARETPFALNPTVIDGCFQLLFVALTQGLTKRLEKTFLPTLIEEIRVRPHAGPVKVEAWSLDGGKTMSIKANSNGVAVFNLRGLHLTPLENDTSGDEDVHAACRVKWARLFEHMNLLPMLKPPLSVVSERIIIEEMTILAIIEHLHSVETIHVKIPYLEKYRDWLKRERQDIERNHSSLITNSSKFTAMSSGERRVQLEQRFQLIAKGSLFASKTGEAILRVCNRGADIFDGKIDTLQVLLEGGLLAEVYNSITFDFSPFIQNLSISRPGLRILEVGAGTGGTTAEIFKHILSPGSLPPFAEYMFTDISAGFFIAAKERFKHVLNMEYAVYDISQNPVQQGFKPETYDIILAANVVHTTASLHSTLSYLRELIRPGGYLLMTEVDTKSQMASYVFGNFSGWWMGENDARVHAPYVTVERWDSELKAAGFGGIKASARDCEDPYHYATAIVSQVPYLIADLPAVTILCGDNDNTIVRGLSNAFHHRSVAVSIIPFGQQQPRDTVVVTTMDVEGYFFQNISEDKFHQFQDFCRQYQSQQCLWLLRPSSLSTSDPRSAQSLGMLQIVRSELSIPVYTLEISPQEPQFVELVMEVIELIRRPDYSEKIAKDQEYIVEGGVIKIGRVETFSLTEEMRSLSPIALNDTATTLHIGTPGSLSTLGWVNQTLDPLDDLDVEVEAKSYGLNFKDLLVGLGLLAPEYANFGVEFAGVVGKVGAQVNDLKVGDRVVSLRDKCFANKVRLPALACAKIPKKLSFSEAGSILGAYATVIHSLVDVGRVSEGQSVLIHSACGGIGHAAISVCRMLGAEIYVTVGTDKKVQYAIEHFGLPRDHIYNSRDESFYTDIMRNTEGQGVDVVLNSLTGELLHASWKCVSEFGMMIELGKRDLIGHGRLDMEPFLKNRTYATVDISHMFAKRPEYSARLVQRTLELYSGGKLQPLPRTEYKATDIEAAFRHLQDGEHVGKVTVDIENVSNLPFGPYPHKKLIFHPQFSYLLTGGLGGLGKSILTWMAERGARNFVILSRSAGASQCDKDFISELETMSCTIILVAGKVENQEAVSRAVASAPTPIRGVFHLAMVQREGPILDMSYQDWTDVIQPKVDGAWNLHNELAGGELDFFILASSMLALVNQPHESNYAAASRFLESFCQYRRGLELPASILSICPITDVGFLADRPAMRRDLQQQGFYFLGEREFLDFVELAILNQRPRNDSKRGGNQAYGGVSVNEGWIGMGLRSLVPLSDPRNRIHWQNDPRMGYFHNVFATTTTTTSTSESSIATFLTAARADPSILSQGSTHELLSQEILRHLQSVLMTTEEHVGVDVSPQSLGVDSLLGIELKRWWMLTFGVEMGTLEVLGSKSVRELGILTATKLAAKIGA